MNLLPRASAWLDTIASELKKHDRQIEMDNETTKVTLELGGAKPPRHVFAPLAKRPLYERTPLIEAIQTELRKSPEPLHHDALIESIFDVPDAETFRRARSTLLSTMRHANGRWTRQLDGRFTLGAGEGIEPRAAAAR